MRWDREVDVVSVGSGAGGLASAIVAVDAGQTVFVAHTGPPPEAVAPPRLTIPGRLNVPGRLNIEVSDVETNAYLDAVTEVLHSARPDTPPVDVPLRVVADPPSFRSCTPHRNVVEPFVGARLGQWAAECVAASHCLVYSHVTRRNLTTMRAESGEKFETAVVGVLAPGIPRDGRSIADWLSRQAQTRGVDVHRDSTLERLVFESGQVVGAVVRTPQGPCAVAARAGVVVTAAGASDAIAPVAASGPLQVCVVSRTASRFARLELMTRVRVSGRAVASSAPRSHGLNARAKCHTVPPGQLHDGGCEL